MHALTAWLGLQEGEQAQRFSFDRPPHGLALVTLDASSTAPAASFNANRILLCGAEGGLTQEGLLELLQLFEASGVRHLFAWLSPGPDADNVREWLRALSFTQIPWTRYPTLTWQGAATPVDTSPFEIRRVGPEDLARARPALGDTVMDGYSRTIGKPGFSHYMAFDASRPIAVAALAQFDEIGYLTYAGTAADHRRRGAQSALISRRVADARALGCTQIVSQTLTMLRDSFANLQRAGFREVYEQEVYEYSRG